MGTDTSSALDQLSMTGTTPKPLRDKVMRIATMTTQLLDEVRTHPLDSAGLDRLRAIDTQIIGELLTDLTPNLRQELQRLALPLTRHTELSDAELRLAHAQLVGWLQGLLQTAHNALSDPHAVLANDSITVEAAEGTSTSSDIPTSPNHLDRPHLEPCSPTKYLPEDIAPNDDDNPAIRSARHTLITAITRRITQQRLTAAQAAAVLHLTGPRVTKLLQENIDEFTLDELVNLLPALKLTIQVVPAPEQYVGHSGRSECRNDRTKPPRSQRSTNRFRKPRIQHGHYRQSGPASKPRGCAQDCGFCRRSALTYDPIPSHQPGTPSTRATVRNLGPALPPPDIARRATYPRHPQQRVCHLLLAELNVPQTHRLP